MTSLPPLITREAITARARTLPPGKMARSIALGQLIAEEKAMGEKTSVLERVARAILHTWCECERSTMTFEELRDAAALSDPDLPKLTAMYETLMKEAHAAIGVCWQEINSHIVHGELSGNGCDAVAQRNGLILAANLLFARDASIAGPQS